MVAEGQTMTTVELELVEPPAAPAANPQRRASDAPLHPGTDPPLAAAEIARWIAPQIAEQIERAAWWPGHTLRENWRLGDYSVYALTFPAPGFKALHVRFVSEPDRTAMLEVSASSEELRFRAAAPDSLRAALVEAGFRPGGVRAGYSKRLLVESREDCQALAEEIAGLVTGCLGYTGREPIEQGHAFGQRTEAARVFTMLTLRDIERLLRSSKLVVYARDRKLGPGFWTAQKPRFLVAPCSEAWPGSGWYRALRFQYSVPMETELAEGVIEVMRRKRSFVEMTAADDQLRLEQCVLVEGGVTEEHLRLQLRNWRGFVATVSAICRRMEADAED
jgi:hypothetical protein